MTIDRRTLLTGAAALPALGGLPFRSAKSQAQNTIRLGVLNDQSALYRDISGPGSTQAVRLAVQESGITQRGINVEVVQADHQNRPDVGSTVARQWIDRDGVDVIIDVPTSSVALAVNTIVRERNKVFLNSGAASSDLTGSACSPNTIHWTYDTYMLARGTGGAMVAAGGRTWFFITADYAFGHALSVTPRLRQLRRRARAGGVRTPFRAPRTSPPSCSRRSGRAPTSSAWPMRAATYHQLIKQARSSASPRGGNQAGRAAGLRDGHPLGWAWKSRRGLVLTETFYLGT
jgi:branched-chain amino acid transport system substrate-binding protein